MSIFFRIISLLTILGALVIIFAGPISRLGVWHWGTALSMMRTSVPVLLGGAGLSLLGVVIGIFTKRHSLIVPGLSATILVGGLVFMLSGMRSSGGENPIHDLTTDFSNPPAISAAANADRKNPASYVGSNPAKRDGGETVRQVQERIYPDLQPLFVRKDPAIVFDAALATAKDLGFAIVHSDKDNGIIEATETSLWFGFIDDFIIRVRPEETGTRIDFRSKSRVGRSDLGANIKRIRTYREKLLAQL